MYIQSYILYTNRSRWVKYDIQELNFGKYYSANYVPPVYITKWNTALFRPIFLPPGALTNTVALTFPYT